MKISSVLASLLLGSSFLLVGCGSSDSVDSTTTTETADLTISGKAVDGYLRFATVCLDLDDNGYCQIGQEPAASTQLDGSYELTATAEQQKHANFTTANLIVFGGQDSDTGKDFGGKLVSAFDINNPTNVFITPLSTMVAAVKESDATLSKADAEQKVADLLGLTPAQVNADPVAEALAGDTEVLSKALELQKAVEVLATTSDFDIAVATENVYQALAEGVKTVDASTLTAADQGVDLVLTNVDTQILGTDAVKLVDAAILLAQNVETAVSTMTVVDDANIAAVANTVDNVKEVIEDEIVAFDFTSGIDFATAVTETSVEDPAYVVTADNVDIVVLENIIENDLGEPVTLTDAELEAILLSAGDTELNTLEDINTVIETDDTLVLGDLETQIADQVAEDETQAALDDAYDASVTAQEVLTTLGSFFMSYDLDSMTAEPAMVKVVDNQFLNYEYNTTSNTFEVLNLNYADMVSTYIELVDGVWATSTESMNMFSPEVSFDEYGNLFFNEGFDSNSKYAITAFDASGLKITDIYDEYAFVSETVFSEGAKFYDVTRTPLETEAFIPTYELWYFEDYIYDDVTGEYIPSGVNANYAGSLDETTGTIIPYTSLDEFITENTRTGALSETSDLYFYSIDSGEYTAFFADNGVLEFYHMGADTNGTPITVGTYEINTVGTTEILFIKPPVEVEDWWMTGRAYTIYSVQDGKVRWGEYAYSASQLSAEDETYVFVNYNETAIMDIYAAMNESVIVDPTAPVLASARQTTETTTSEADFITLENKKQAQRAREASLKSYRGF